MLKKLKELKVGDQFTYAGTQYVKMNPVKVSCCRSVNMHVVGNTAQRTFLNPDVEVTVNA